MLEALRRRGVPASGSGAGTAEEGDHHWEADGLIESAVESMKAVAGRVDEARRRKEAEEKSRVILERIEGHNVSPLPSFPSYKLSHPNIDHYTLARLPRIPPLPRNMRPCRVTRCLASPPHPRTYLFDGARAILWRLPVCGWVPFVGEGVKRTGV